MNILTFMIAEVLFVIFRVQCADFQMKTLSNCNSINISTEKVNVMENIIFNYSTQLILSHIGNNLICFSSYERVAEIFNLTIIKYVNSNINENIVYFILKTNRLGEATVKCICQNRYGNNNTFDVLKIVVDRKNTLVEIMFRICVLIFVTLITFVVGCSIDIKIILEYYKNPISPAIGLLAQYLIMPLIAFGISKLLFVNEEFGFGLITVGCSPGGGSSNIWTFLFNGDLNLSMTLTFISTITAFLMMPFWIFCYSRFFFDLKFVAIPFEYVLLNIFQIVIPIILGALMRWKWQYMTLKIIKVSKFVSLIVILFLLISGIYANLYMYKLILDYPYLIPIVAMLPWLGFLFGFLFGILCKQGVTRSLTISIEVGIQNIGISILLLKFTMPKPFGDLAALIPIIVLLVTPLPLLFGYICRLIIFYFLKRKRKFKNSNNLPLSSYTMYQPVFLLNEIGITTKESTIEPTLYYTEDPSEYIDSTMDD